MPTRARRSQWLSGVSHAVLAVLVLVGCTTTVDGSGHSRSDVPASGYDVAVFLCPSNGPTRPCRSGVTPAQTAAVRTRLSHDPAAAGVLYVSERDQYKIASLVLPRSQLQFIRVGDLPADFLVALRDPSTRSAFDARYGKLPGVSVAEPCPPHRCSLNLLRRAGVVP